MPVQTRSGGHRSTSAPHEKAEVSHRRGRRRRVATAESKKHTGEQKQVGDKREAEEEVEPRDEEKETGMEEAHAKKARTDEDEAKRYSFQEGAIERGHIYFFYRPKVQHEEVQDIDDVKNFHMLLIPRPPEFSVHTEGQHSSEVKTDNQDSDEMSIIAEGADVVPAPSPKDQLKTHFRLITIGKKRLPDPDVPSGKGVYWASITAVGDDLHSLEKGLGERSYQTKTRGERHEGPVRLAGRGVYAIVNTRGKTVSRNVTHLGYHLSHPSEAGEVQLELGIHTASSFVLQVKNPEAEPTSFGQRVGLPAGRRASYPEGILKYVFEKETRGRSFGLRFTPCKCIDLLDYEGAELLLIAARSGTKGTDESLGENRGEALKTVGERESQEPTEEIFRELAIEKDHFPAEPIEGKWI
ncbi:hypothetical protein BKA82DRAFT_2734211 [Pisolithus tinctorius]|nr:hypothetical protein BKA82DRAFT_2734211 [Pisolithus tinctorius]